MKTSSNFYAKVIYSQVVYCHCCIYTHKKHFARIRKFTTLHRCNIVYLQYGGVYYCRQNDVTVTRIGGVRTDQSIDQTMWNTQRLI